MTVTPMADTRPLGSAAEVAAYLQIPVTTLKQWRWLGTGPPYIYIGRHVRYCWRDVDEWLAGRKHGGDAP